MDESIRSDAQSQELARDAKPARKSGCHTRDLDGEQVIYDPQTHEVCVLNPTAVFILELCDGDTSVGTMLERLQQRFDAPVDVLARDLGTTLDDLLGKSLLTQ